MPWRALFRFGAALAVRRVGVTGFEPATSWSRTKQCLDASDGIKGVTDDAPAACTTACTSNQEIAKAIDLDALAADLMKLPKNDRARLLAKLLGKGEAKAD